MATDIAFAVGVLALLGQRVRPALRILLLALAVIDDLGAIVVIALFYSTGLSVTGLAVAALGLALIVTMQKLGIRSPWAYLPAGLIAWAGAYASGIHPTMAGVVIGLLTPVRAWLGPNEFADHANAAADAARTSGGKTADDLLTKFADLDLARREAVSPVERLQYALHPWVAFLIMPVFALANAGVQLGDARLGGAGTAVLLGVTLGLVVGKPLGVVVLSALAVRLRLAALPTGVRWPDVLVVGTVAGIGFTMALFIASLAFPPGPLNEVAKLGILCASGFAALAGLIMGRTLLSPVAPEGAAPGAAEAEASTNA
jgi:NhaA family Na+:H+ antiporter